jgi:hypothetical protein
MTSSMSHGNTWRSASSKLCLSTRFVCARTSFSTNFWSSLFLLCEWIHPSTDQQWSHTEAEHMTPGDRKRQKKSPKWQGDRVQRKLNFQWRNEQMAMSVIQSVSNPAPLILLWLFPEAYHCVARNEFYKTMSCLISPRPPHRDHTSLHSPLPHPLSMHFKVQVRRKVTNFLY